MSGNICQASPNGRNVDATACMAFEHVRAIGANDSVGARFD